MPRKSYPTDLTDKQWNILEQLIPASKTGGRPRAVDMRDNHQRYFLHQAPVAAQPRLMPHDFPAWSTVYYYFRI